MVGAGSDAIQVAVRVKPLDEQERHQRIQTSVRVADGQVIVGSEKIFAFDHVYPADCSTNRIFDSLIVPLVDNAFLQGYNATVFAYGQTGSGKSFTVNGIVQLATRRLFEYLRDVEASNANSNQGEQESVSAPLVTISMLELHNETLVDLLAPQSTSQALVIRDGDPERGVVIQNLQEYPTESEDDINKVIDLGMSNRSVAATLMNQTSSRSHMMITFTLRMQGMTSKLNLVDLAGSERVKKSLGNLKATAVGFGDPSQSQAAAAAQAVSDRLREAIAINSGLLALGNVITALCTKQQHVPFRSSKLTRILQDSLAGNCRTAMIACVSSADTNTEETLSTLKYANRAKSLVTRAVQNITGNAEEAAATIASLRREVDSLRSALSRLQLQAVTGGVDTSSLDPGSQMSRVLNQSRDAFLQVQAEVSELREQLTHAADELDKERRVTRVLEEDLFKAEYAAMAAKEALLVARREIAEMRGEDPSLITAGTLTSFMENAAGAYGKMDQDSSGDEALHRLEEERAANLNNLAETMLSVQPRAPHSTTPPPGSHRAAALQQQQINNDEQEQEAIIRRMRAELHDKEQQIKFLSDTCDFAEGQISEYEARLHSADSEVRRLEMGLHSALQKLEQTGVQSVRLEQQRQQIIASYDARLQTEKAAAAEVRRRLAEMRAEMKQRAADRERLRHLQHEAAALADRVRAQQDAQRRNENKSRTQHQQEVQNLHRALRDAKAENRRMIALMRKKEEEFQTRMAMMQREGPSRHHGARHDDPTSMPQSTPRIPSNNHFTQSYSITSVSNANNHPSNAAPADHDSAGRDHVARGAAHSNPVNRLMLPTASSRARANPPVNVVSLAARDSGASGGEPPSHVGGNLPLIVNTGKGPSSRGQARQASPPAAQSPAEVAAEALYKRLGELDQLDRELNGIVEERDRRAAEFTKVNQSYNAHRMQRALDAWRYYASQLQEKMSNCTDAAEREQLEKKSDEVARRIQALEETIPAACAQQQQELQQLDETIDNFRVKRNVLLNIIRSLQDESKAASVPRQRRSQSAQGGEDDDDIRDAHQQQHHDQYDQSSHYQHHHQQQQPVVVPPLRPMPARFSSRGQTPRSQQATPRE